jgi:glycogen debranching enzyme
MIAAVALTVLDGSTFCISDESGDIIGGAAGLYADDTRHLSRLLLTLDGERPLLLTSRTVDYFSAAFYLRNPASPTLPQDALLISRRRFVGDGMQDHLSVVNQAMEPVAFELALALGADFADIITVKEHDIALGARVGAGPLPPPGECRFDRDRNELLFSDAESAGGARTQVVLSRPGEVDGARVRFSIELEPRECWELRLDVAPLSSGVRRRDPARLERRFGEEYRLLRESLEAWHLRLPRLRASWRPLQRAYERSAADIAALRLRGGSGALERLPAAGMPWFMTIFGRDTIIASLQTLVFGPELATATLETLTELQATEDDPGIDAEPGKIIHELRQGKAAQTWFPRYYGTSDATPLYLVLLSELWRWTDDATLVTRFKGPALAALAWIDRHGDRDGDGFVEYARRTSRGLPNQSWKDSTDSQRFADGRLAQTPIAPCEVQGYVFDAKRRLAEIARDGWNDPALADRLEREADGLRDRFDKAYWVDRRGGYYALALDGEKRQVDSLCSNIGHLLWSGIVPEDRAEAIVERLMGEELWSGWGVRTMSTGDAGYSPLAYHNGTVWPHDNSLIAQGLARYGRWVEAQRIAHGLLTAAAHFDYQLPEVFAGVARAETPFPIAYPVAAHPQAWAAGAAVLLLQVLLGLRPNRRTRTLETAAPPDLPAWVGAVRLSGVRAFGRSWDARLKGGRVSVATAP